MSKSERNRKRKAVPRDSPQSEQAALFDELGDGPLDEVFSQDEDESPSASEGKEVEEEDEGPDEAGDSDLASDEIPELEDDLLHEKQVNGATHTTSDSLRQQDTETAPSENDETERPNYTETTDANGNPRYFYRDVDTVYDSDDSDAPATTNTIGNIPLSFYDSYPHIGYDINGHKVQRPAKGAALDMLLDNIDLPAGWTGLTDLATGKPLELSAEELDVLKRLARNEVPGDGYDPYPDMVEYFSGILEPMPLSAAPEPKRRFVPSRHEANRVMKIVKAIKEGRIQPYRPPQELDEDHEAEADTKRYDIWADEAPRPDHPMNVPAPKLPPPSYDESYRPPPEYVPDPDEASAWHALDEDDRDKPYLPARHDALRRVPGYGRLLKERFERCLDLYLAPRVRRSRLDIDPESLLPALPRPEELRPFPSRCARVFAGHEGRVRAVAVDPLGVWLASGGDDGTVRVWNLNTGREVWRARLAADGEAANVVKWRPGTAACVLAAAAGDTVYLAAPDLPSPVDAPETVQATRELLTAGFSNTSATTSTNTNLAPTKDSPARWTRPLPNLQSLGVLLQLTVRSTVKSLAFHRRGDYFTTVSPAAAHAAVAIHTLSKHTSQLPFRRLKGLAQTAAWHPSKPVLFVATQRSIRGYDLSRQELIHTLRPGARWISALDVHPGGDNLLVGSFDRRLLWMDVELAATPYKTLRYHAKGIRAVRFHAGGWPLFADASDDGSVQVFHGKVVDDLMQNATIVPLKVLKGHAIVGGLGVLDIDWHPREPCLVSAGADGTCRLWQ